MDSFATEHWQYLVALARRSGDVDAEDVAQDVFERWLRSRDRLAPSTNVRAWMAVVLRHLVIDRQRRRRISPVRLAQGEQTVEAHGAEPAPHAEPDRWWYALGRGDVEAALEGLSPPQRTAFELFELEGKSYDEVAAALQISRSTVGVRVLRARRRLRELLSSRAVAA